MRTDAAAADAFLRDLAVEGALASSDLRSGPVQTIGGASVDVAVSGSSITYGGAPVSEADIPASNGVAHALSALPEVS